MLGTCRYRCLVLSPSSEEEEEEALLGIAARLQTKEKIRYTLATRRAFKAEILHRRRRRRTKNSRKTNHTLLTTTRQIWARNCTSGMTVVFSSKSSIPSCPQKDQAVELAADALAITIPGIMLISAGTIAQYAINHSLMRSAAQRAWANTSNGVTDTTRKRSSLKYPLADRGDR